MICAACHCEGSDCEEFLTCCKEECSKHYHLLCSGVKTPSTLNASSWVCPECSCSLKKGGDNSLTPVGLHKKTRDQNVTYRKKPITVYDTENQNVTRELYSEVKILREEISLLKNQLSQTNLAIITYQNKFEEFFVLHTSLMEQYSKGMQRTAEVEVNDIEKTSSAEPNAALHMHVSGADMHAPQPPIGDSHEAHVSTHTLDLSTVPSPTDAPSNVNQSRLLEDITDKEEWTVVRKTRRTRPMSLRGIASPSVTFLKAVEERKCLHLWNMESDAQDVLCYLKKLCPEGNCIVEELKAKGNYKSYKITIPVAYYETCYSQDVWPVNARIKPWIQIRKPSEFRHNSKVDSQLPFRDQGRPHRAQH